MYTKKKVENKINIYVIHYTKLTDRYNYFSNKNISFNFITEKNVKSIKCKVKIIKFDLLQMFWFINSIYLGHISNILRIRLISKYLLNLLSTVLFLEQILFKNKIMYLYIVDKIKYSDKIEQINLMHAKALFQSSKKNEFCIILEDDSIFKSKNLKKTISDMKNFINLDKETMIFFTQPSVILKTTLEDSFQFNKDFIRIHPPLAKGASAYILRQELAKDLANFIKTTSVKLPIDLLISYWAQKKNIKVYWQRNPVVREGSGNIYKSSLR